MRFKSRSFILTILAFCFIASPAIIAAPPKQQAFGPIQFGDSVEESQKALMKIAEAANRRQAEITASDVMKQFVTATSKYPPKLTSKYNKVVVDLKCAPSPAVASLDVVSRDKPEGSYATEVKDAWEVFRDIANAKFGKPIESAPFPPPDIASTGITTATTDKWTIGTLEIRVGVRTTKIGANDRKFQAVLTATDTSWDTANKAQK